MQLIEIGEIKAVYGVKGWVKVFSYTRPIEQIFSYKCWFIGQNADEYQLEDCNQRSNSGLIAKIKGVDDRTEAAAFIGKTIAIDKSELPELENEFYWSQIIGLDVINSKGELLGQVIQMIETGANDVMVVTTDDERCDDGTRRYDEQRLIPYAQSVVLGVELDNGRIIVDWEMDY